VKDGWGTRYSLHPKVSSHNCHGSPQKGNYIFTIEKSGGKHLNQEMGFKIISNRKYFHRHLLSEPHST
jgi:hypothetical protein